MQQPQDFQRIRQIGEHTITLPECPSVEQIAYHDKPQAEQYFRRTYLPDNWKTMSLEERSEFAKTEWHKRMNGFWFYNFGNIEYMTGRQYLYCNWWKIDGAALDFTPDDPRDWYFPMWIDADRDWFYFEDYCDKDPKCVGLFTIERRRAGKTQRVSCVQYEKISRSKNSKGGIQGRDDADARKIFQKLIYGWKNLPPFFKPTDVGESNPAKELVFDEPRKSTRKTQDKEYSETLNSVINFGNANEGYYDGMRLLSCIQDEIGKLKSDSGIDLLERIKVVKVCCMIGTTVVGKILATTTVEEMEKGGGEQARKLWLRSTTLDAEAKLNPKIFKTGKAKSANGMTVSGLYRYKQFAYNGFFGKDNNGVPFINRYGYTDTARAKQYIIDDRANYTGADLATERRKFPIEDRDFWISNQAQATYDTQRIEQQLEYIETLAPNARLGQINMPLEGTFAWKNGQRDTTVEFYPKNGGFSSVAWMPPIEKRNLYTMQFNGKCPSNANVGAMGIDPYDDKFTFSKDKSDAACYGVLKYNPLDPQDSYIPVYQYLGRPSDPEIMYEEILCACVFYGWKILAEKNKEGLIRYFEKRGYFGYIMMRPAFTESEWSKKNSLEETPGITMTGDVPRQTLIQTIETFIAGNVGEIINTDGSKRMGKVLFQKLLEQLRDFEFGAKWTEYDAMVGFGIALIAVQDYTPPEEEIILMEYFPQYKIGNDGSPSPVKMNNDKPESGMLNPVLRNIEPFKSNPHYVPQPKPAYQPRFTNPLIET